MRIVLAIHSPFPNSFVCVYLQKLKEPDIPEPTSAASSTESNTTSDFGGAIAPLEPSVSAKESSAESSASAKEVPASTKESPEEKLRRCVWYYSSTIFPGVGEEQIEHKKQNPIGLVVTVKSTGLLCSVVAMKTLA